MYKISFETKKQHSIVDIVKVLNPLMRSIDASMCFLFFFCFLQRHRNYVKQQKRAANKRALRKWRSFEMNADEYYREVCITSPASFNNH